MTGTLVNAAAVAAGSGLGLLVHSRLNERFISITFQAIGLFTLFLGVNMALKTANLMIPIFSILIGGLIGESLKLEERTHSFTEKIKVKFKFKHEHFSEGLITAFLIFCIGSMTILGAIEEGLGNPPRLLLTKSILDGFASIALASSLGIGVLFSFVPLLIFQGAITLLAGQTQQILSPALIQEVTTVGGLLILGLGINLLEIKKLRILNMIPSLIVAGGLFYLIQWIG
jgi:uncharacterized membrane protein YqgA involved in biofilm formation